MLRLGGQLRVAGMGGVAGIDASAALAMAEALGHDVTAMAAFLGSIEAGILAGIASQRSEGDG